MFRIFGYEISYKFINRILAWSTVIFQLYWNKIGFGAIIIFCLTIIEG